MSIGAYINTRGCGCCTYDYKVEVTGEMLMPDGKVILLLKEVDGDRIWWYDKDLEVHSGDWDD